MPDTVSERRVVFKKELMLEKRTEEGVGFISEVMLHKAGRGNYSLNVR